MKKMKLKNGDIHRKYPLFIHIGDVRIQKWEIGFLKDGRSVILPKQSIFERIKDGKLVIASEKIIFTDFMIYDDVSKSFKLLWEKSEETSIQHTCIRCGKSTSDYFCSEECKNKDQAGMVL